MQNTPPTTAKGKRFFIAPILILLGVIYVCFLLYQAIFVNYQTNKKISVLNKELEKSKADKEDLEVLIAYYKTSAFQELEARRKLGLKLPGEKVIKVEVQKPAQPVSSSTFDEEGHKKKSNPEQWIDFFCFIPTQKIKKT